MTTTDFIRGEVLHWVLGATSLAEIEKAKQMLRAWLAAHPDEEGMRDGFEQLYMMEEAALLTLAAQAQEREKAA